jgi:ribosomal protein S18 acetylase RimI-like enzyme
MDIQFIDKNDGNTDKKSLTDIYKIGKSSLPIYYKLFHLLDFLNDPMYIIYKCVLKNKIIGYVIIEICNDMRIHIMSIAILNQYRRRGYGSQILTFLRNKFENYTISLYVQIANKQAVKFYIKNGFEIKKKIENYYNELEYKDAYYCEISTIIK